MNSFRPYRIDLFLVIIMIGLFSCSKHSERVEPEERELATIDVFASGVKPQSPGTDANPDNVITSLRVMIFNSGSLLAYNKMIDLSEGTTFPITIYTGNYDFVFVANEGSDESVHSNGKTLTQILDSYSGKGISAVYDEYFASSAFRNDYAIPMTRVIRNVQVSGDNTITVGGDPQESPWVVEMKRAAIRMDLFLKTTSLELTQQFTRFQVLNIPDKVYFFEEEWGGLPKYNVKGPESFETVSPLHPYRYFASDKGDAYAERTPEYEGDVDYSITEVDPGLRFAESSTESGAYYWYKRLVLPSSVFFPSDQKGLGIVFQVVAHGHPYSLTLSRPASTDYTISRNSRYKLQVNFSPNYIGFDVSVIPWGDNVDVPLSPEK